MFLLLNLDDGPKLASWLNETDKQTDRLHGLYVYLSVCSPMLDPARFALLRPSVGEKKNARFFLPI